MENTNKTDLLKATLRKDLGNLKKFFQMNFDPINRAEQIGIAFNKFDELMTPTGPKTKSAEVVYENPSMDLTASILQLVADVKDLSKAHSAGLNIPHITAVNSLTKNDGGFVATNSGIMNVIVIELPTPDGLKTKDLVQIEIFYGNDSGYPSKPYQGDIAKDLKMAGEIDNIINRASRNSVQRIDITKISIKGN